MTDSVTVVLKLAVTIVCGALQVHSRATRQSRMRGRSSTRVPLGTHGLPVAAAVVTWTAAMGSLVAAVATAAASPCR